jgi:lysophospholipase L1-like esterase
VASTVDAVPLRSESDPNAARRLRRIIAVVATSVALLVIAIIAIDLAILIVPPQAAQVFGQTIRLGAVRPSLSVAGPSHVVLFSQTLSFMPRVDFPGLIRPLASLTRLSTSSYLGQLTDGQHPAAATAATKAAKHAIVVGWVSYLAWVAGVAALISGILGALVHRAVTRRGLSRTAWHGIVAILVTLAILGVNVGADYQVGRQIVTDPHLVESLFNRSGVTAPPPVSSKDRSTQIVVLGDSTEAGEGLPLTAKKYSPDWLCNRSPDAAAEQLKVTGLTVTNLSCSGATIEQGIMGAQLRYGRTISPQLSALESMTDVKAIFVGVGADDVGWSNIIKACVGLASCDNQATAAAFDQYLEPFVKNYYNLLLSLQDIAAKLKPRPAVVIDQYYDPFGAISNCSALHKTGWPGLDGDKAAFLSGLLGQLNATLAEGAKEAGFSTAAVSFSGNALCDKVPYVQGFGDPAPFHPNALGQMQIAMSDLAALPANWRTGTETASKQ